MRSAPSAYSISHRLSSRHPKSYLEKSSTHRWPRRTEVENRKFSSALFRSLVGRSMVRAIRRRGFGKSNIFSYNVRRGAFANSLAVWIPYAVVQQEECLVGPRVIRRIFVHVFSQLDAPDFLQCVSFLLN
ncbi:hypothetical protein A0H81_04079 [Grifola frondosa]|uniref:Uncharacterized protein n=1 Tax=Grifola frondosa TaxID=5627 RepID=A0A1C7MGE5_GRIFR|nr:hypothetical protein A0H81_04079 [Grifola frondosa]